MLYQRKEPLPGARVIDPERVRFVEEGLHYEMAVEYGQVDGAPLLMDYFYPKNHEGKMPAVIWIHGGGWSSHDLTRVYRPERELAELAKQGFFCASIDYRLSDQAIFPAQIQDCKCAVRYLRAHAEELHIDAAHIGTWGESAGAHLALMMAMTDGVPEFEGNGGWKDESSKVQAAVSWYAPCELNKLHTYYHHEPSIVERLLGCSHTDPDFIQKADAASPMHYAIKSDMPLLLMHGDRDSVVPLEQSEALAKAAWAAGKKETRMVVVHDQGHGFFQGQEYIQAIYNFFHQHLKGTDRAKELHQGEGGHVIWEKPLDWEAAGVTYLPDQTYATLSGVELKVDWMLPKGRDGERLPVVVWFHGGGWRAEDLNRRYRPERLLAKLCHAGFACVSADYRLLQQAAYPAPIQDARCVIRYVRAMADRFSLDAEHIGVMGESAGAGTAQLLGVGRYLPEHEGDGGYNEYSSEVQAVCSWYGFSNHLKSAQLSGQRKNFFLGVEDDYDGPGAQQMYKESPIAYANRPLPPFLLLHGSADPLVPVWQSIDFYHELTSYGRDAELYVVPGEVHGFFTDAKTPEMILQFFTRCLKKQ